MDDLRAGLVSAGRAVTEAQQEADEVKRQVAQQESALAAKYGTTIDVLKRLGEVTCAPSPAHAPSRPPRPPFPQPLPTPPSRPPPRSLHRPPAHSPHTLSPPARPPPSSPPPLSPLPSPPSPTL